LTHYERKSITPSSRRRRAVGHAADRFEVVFEDCGELARQLGLRSLLLTRDDGYILDPSADVKVEEG